MIIIATISKSISRLYIARIMPIFATRIYVFTPLWLSNNRYVVANSLSISDMDRSVTFVPWSSYNWEFTPYYGGLPWNPAVYCFVAAVITLTYFLALESLLVASRTFERHSSVYFGSIVCTAIGIILYTTGTMCGFFGLIQDPGQILGITLSAQVMILSGFSIVIWSRLHLIIQNPEFLRGLLMLIILTSVILHGVAIPIYLVLGFYKKKVSPTKYAGFADSAVFTAQEAFCTSLYIFKTIRFIRSPYSKNTQRTICLLVLVQLTVMATDAISWFLQVSNRILIATIMHGFFYSLKLRLEIVVLNELQDLIKAGRLTGLGVISDELGQDRITTVSTTPAMVEKLPNPRQELPSLSDSSLFDMAGISERTGDMSSNNHHPDLISQCKPRENEKVTENDGQLCQSGDDLDELEARYLGR